jgi:hypothetical protein
MVLSPGVLNPLSAAKYPTFFLAKAAELPPSWPTSIISTLALRLACSSTTPTRQSKPIAQTPSSGLVQHIFSSPPRLRLRCLLAHIRCRRGPKLKMLCIILRPRERAREAALLPSTAGVRRRGNLVHRPDSPAVNRLKEQIRLLDFAPALV